MWNKIVWLSAITLIIFLGGCVDSTRDLDQAISFENENPNDNGDTDNSEPSEEFSLTSMLVNLSDNIFVVNYQALADKTATLASTDGPLSTYCDAIGTASENATFEDAKASWKHAMNAMQDTEMHVIGPAQANEGARRHRILSYSLEPLSTCGADEIATNYLVENSSFDVTIRSVNQRGLGGIEYLVFNSDLQHTCPPQVPSTNTWNDLSEDNRKLARCRAALALAEDTALAAQQIHNSWNSSYRDEFVSESNAGNNLQSLTDAIFYLDTGVKDKKLGIPLGINDSCSSITCPNNVESRYSNHSAENLSRNLSSFLNIFTGGNGIGFDDLINDEGFPDVTQDFSNAVNAAITALSTISIPVYEQVLSIDTPEEEAQCSNAFANPDTPDDLSACTIYGLIKRVTDTLKIDFVTIVNVNLPDGAQADND